MFYTVFCCFHSLLKLARQPLFFREINPQPKKHTLWQATADFTGGEASKYRFVGVLISAAFEYERHRKRLLNLVVSCIGFILIEIT